VAADGRLAGLLDRAVSRDGGGQAVFLTGAGISAESGIPTFRGEEGYWQVGSRNFHPMELATWMAFQRMPEDIWGWYLFRRAACRSARPNAAHEAIAALEPQLADRFLLVTQNVDGLHLRAGNSAARTYQIHGNIDFARCAATCTGEIFALPDDLGLTWARGRRPDEHEKKQLSCVRCGGWLRPHVLWFDEAYDEERFRFESSLRAAGTAALLVVVGTSGATTLPSRMCETAVRQGVPLLVIDPGPTSFGELADRSDGVSILGTACAEVPALCQQIAARFSARMA
jgi:NAD-dependent deacetylase